MKSLWRSLEVCYFLFFRPKLQYFFLEKIGPVRRFHPSFLAKLDAECVDIEPATLPEPPRKEVAFKNVEEFMSSLREPETAVDVALKELAAGEETSTSRNIPLSPKKFAQIQAAKPAGARSLLERVRLC